MRLTLSILRCPDRVAPETRRFDGGEVVVGRGPGADWVLTDTAAKPLLSRRHCTLAFRAGAWTLTDTSTNGTTLNGAPVPEGQPTRALRDGDRLGIGPYEIEVSLAADQQAASGFGGQDWNSPPQPAASPFGGSAFGEASPFGGGQPFGAAQGFAAIPEPQHGTALEPFAGASIVLPEDFGADLLSPTPPPSRPPAQPDHTPAFGDVLQPPNARTLLPSGWDDGPGFESPAAPAAPPPAPFASAPPAMPASLPALDPFAEAAVSPFLEVTPPAPAAPATLPPVLAPAPPAMPVAVAPAPAAVQPAPALAPEDANVVTAFYAGAQLEDARPAQPVAAMREAGAAFRAFVRGLRRVLIARAEVKSAFRIDQTMVRSRNNNPLKFAVSDDDALAALLGAGRRSDMAAADAVEGALNDIRLHELATMAAMQEAMTELLGKLDPAQFLAAAEGGFLPAQKRARAYDLYEAEFRKLREAFTEKFDDAFGRAFARAYERVVADLQSREPLH